MDKLYEESLLKQIRFHKEGIELCSENIEYNKTNIIRLKKEIKEHLQYLENTEKELEVLNKRK